MVRDPQSIRLLIVAVQSIFILGFAVEMYRSANAVESVRLTTIFWKAAFHTSIFAVARIAASYADNVYFEFETGYCGASVMTAAFALIWFRAFRLRRILASHRNDELRVSLREDFDVIINRIEQARQNVRKLMP